VKSTALRGRSIFVYEYLSAGAGLREIDRPLPESLEQEGLAMLRAVVADFAAAGARVSTICRLNLDDADPTQIDVHRPVFHDDEVSLFCHLAGRADWSVVITPELGGALFERCRLARSAGGCLLASSEADLILSGDKHLACLHLAARGLPVPQGITVDRGQLQPGDFTYPAVLKRRDGAGSQDVRMVESPADVCGPIEFDARLESFCAGLPVSVALLCGPAGIHSLPACRQHLASDGRFAYQGGELPLPEDLDARARRLALRAIEALTAPLGYLGVDLVLGDADDGSQDYVIEINPRLTTSYVGLRQAMRNNLAAAMVAIAEGAEVPLSFRAERVDWTADGRISKGNR